MPRPTRDQHVRHSATVTRRSAERSQPRDPAGSEPDSADRSAIIAGGHVGRVAAHQVTPRRPRVVTTTRTPIP